MNILPIKSSKEAAQEALREIELGLTGQQQGLLCRWSKVNKAMLGSFRFGNTIVLSGMSGGGKSYFLNMLRKDFENKELNRKFTKPFKQLHFAFEMSASDEIIRDIGAEIRTSYANVISAYERLPQHKFEQIKSYLKQVEDYNIDYIEVTGNVQQIYDTIKYYKSLYPNHELIISFDHTLLTDFLNEHDEIALVSKLSKMFLQIRKELRTLNIIVAQLNDNIEDPIRLKNPSMHYPSKRDIFGGKAIFRDSDAVFVVHTPEKLGLTEYGVKKYGTSEAMFLHLIKMRKGIPGMIRFHDDLANGNYIQIEN